MANKKAKQKKVSPGKRVFNILKGVSQKRKLTPTEKEGNSKYTVDKASGVVRSIKDMEFVDHLLEARRKKKPWEIIDMIVERWAQSAPKQFEVFKVHLENTRQDMKDKKFASTDSKTADRRMTMIFPTQLHSMIRSVYKADELVMDKEFNVDFCKRYPFFQVPEKL